MFSNLHNTEPQGHNANQVDDDRNRSFRHIKGGLHYGMENI